VIRDDEVVRAGDAPELSRGGDELWLLVDLVEHNPPLLLHVAGRKDERQQAHGGNLKPRAASEYPDRDPRGHGEHDG